MQTWNPKKEAGAKMVPTKWYAEPLGRLDATILLKQTQQIQQRLYLQPDSQQNAQPSNFLHRPDTLSCSLQTMIARYWLESCMDYWSVDSIEAEYLSLTKTHVHSLEKALIELVFGQLLISKKLRGAMEYLNRSFAYAQEFLNAEEYFQILHCYEQLSHLRLLDTPRPAQDLHSLLDEAAIIDKLEQHSPQRRMLQRNAACKAEGYRESSYQTGHCDTVN